MTTTPHTVSFLGLGEMGSALARAAIQAGHPTTASRDQGISTEIVDVVQRLIHRQIDAGHGSHGFARVIESIKHPEVAA